MDAIAFQKQFILAVCNTLESIFEDNYIIGVFKILDPTNMSSRQVGLVY